MSHLQDSLNQALHLHRSGRVQEAIDLYRKLLRKHPANAQLLHLLGTANFQMGQVGLAIEQLKRSLVFDNANPFVHYNLGLVYQTQQRMEEALISYDRALGLKPDHVDACNNRGNVLKELGRFDEALLAYEKALTLRPDYAEAHSNRGNILGELNRFGEALESFERALALRPQYADAYTNCSNVFIKLERLNEALVSCEKAIELEPSRPEAYNSRGNALFELRRLDEALASLDKALALKPNYPEAEYNRGLVLHDLKRLNEALASFDKSLALKPDYAEAHNNRGHVLHDLKRLDEALASFDKALALKPNHAKAYYNQGITYEDLKYLDEARASYDKAFALEPNLEFLAGSRLDLSMALCDWTGFSEALEGLVKGIQEAKPVTPPFELLSLLDFPELHLKASRIYADKKFKNKEVPGQFANRTPDTKIRIGYFSADFRNHPLSFLMAGQFELHDRSRFDVYGFSLGPDTNDEIRQRIAAAMDKFIDVHGMSDQEVARLSRELGIDIAVDLGGYTADSRTNVFAERAAPIQVNYMGYPGTMGADFIDYVIADKTVIPTERRSNFVEKVVYLPHTYWVNDSKLRISDKPFTRPELGLPEDGFVFCCFNQNHKILPATFDGWMRILNAVDSSVLWLLKDNPIAVKNLCKEAEKRGVDSNRLVFAKRMQRDEHLARHRYADLLIDTLPYNAHTTASDALWAGLPVLTCMGQSFASRVAASLLYAIDLPELITHTQEEYEAMAIELATHPDRLREIKDKLERNRLTTPLFDTQLFTKHVEAAYEAMYVRYQANLPPDVIEVKRF